MELLSIPVTFGVLFGGIELARLLADRIADPGLRYIIGTILGFAVLYLSCTIGALFWNARRIRRHGWEAVRCIFLGRPFPV